MAHQHYKGTGKVHSFRGLLTDGEQQKIRIEGAVGAIAWRIVKFEIISNQPGLVGYEHLVQIWREEQATVPTASATVDFENDELLAVATSMSSDSQGYGPFTPAAIFDNQLFVRNIWATHTDNFSTISCNYYVELEEVKVSAAGMAQLAVAAARRT